MNMLSIISLNISNDDKANAWLYGALSQSPDHGVLI